MAKTLKTILFWLALSQGSQALGIPVAKLLRVTGQAEVLKDGKSTPCGNGFELELHDQLNVQAASSAVVILRDKSLLFVKENSSLQITESMLRKTGETTVSTLVIDLLRGKVAASVQKQNPEDVFKVRTESIAMGVRGTKFTVSADDNPSVVVSEGEVAVTPSKVEGAEVVISQGEVAQLKPGERKVESAKASDKALRELASAFSAIEEVSVAASAKAVEFTKRATSAALSILNEAGSATVSTLDSSVRSLQNAGSDAINTLGDGARKIGEAGSDTLTALDEGLRSMAEQRKVLYGAIVLHSSPRRLESRSGNPTGGAVGVKFLQARSQDLTFIDKQAEVSLARSGPLHLIDGTFAAHWGRILSWTAAEPSITFAAKLRHWSGNEVSRNSERSRTSTGITYGPAVGLDIIYPLSGTLAAEFQTWSTYWVGKAPGFESGASLGLGLRL